MKPKNRNRRASSLNSPEDLRRYGHEQAHREEWGPNPPLWHTALAQADWEAEAYLTELQRETNEQDIH